jgi:hypothetical protein
LFLRCLRTIVLLAMPLHALGLGLLTAHGSVRLNGFRVWDNATAMDNMTVETDRVCARITLNAGAEILLAPATRIRIANGTLTLETGSAMIRHAEAIQIRATRLSHDPTGAVLAGPAAASIPRLLDSLVEERPLSQRP